MEFIRGLVLSLKRPSAPNEDPELTLLRFLAHAVAGGALSMFLGPYPGLLSAVILGVTYFVLKETADIRSGGGVFDSIADSIAIAIGVFLDPIVCLIVIGLGLAHAFIQYKRNER